MGRPVYRYLQAEDTFVKGRGACFSRSNIALSGGLRRSRTIACACCAVSNVYLQAFTTRMLPEMSVRAEESVHFSPDAAAKQSGQLSAAPAAKEWRRTLLQQPGTAATKESMGTPLTIVSRSQPWCWPVGAHSAGVSTRRLAGSVPRTPAWPGVPLHPDRAPLPSQCPAALPPLPLHLVGVTELHGSPVDGLRTLPVAGCSAGHLAPGLLRGPGGNPSFVQRQERTHLPLRQRPPQT